MTVRSMQRMDSTERYRWCFWNDRGEEINLTAGELRDLFGDLAIFLSPEKP